MTDYPYDPELPFVVARTKAPVRIVARFRDEIYARGMADGIPDGWTEVIDTTPAPKIPEGAEFIHYTFGSGVSIPYYARRYGNPANRVWELDTARHVSEDDLLKEIGDAEIVVLKRA